jgi:hypothetical protein
VGRPNGDPLRGGIASALWLTTELESRCTAARVVRPMLGRALSSGEERRASLPGVAARRVVSSRRELTAVSRLPEAPVTVQRNLAPMRLEMRLGSGLRVYVFEHSVSAQFDVPVSHEGFGSPQRSTQTYSRRGPRYTKSTLLAPGAARGQPRGFEKHVRNCRSNR